MSGDARDGGGAGGGGAGGGGGDDERAHARIEAALREVGAELTAPAGWEERVLAAIAAEDAQAAKAPAQPAKPAQPAPEKPRRRWWTYALAAATTAVLAAVLLWVVLPREALSPTKPAPAVAMSDLRVKQLSGSLNRGEHGTGRVVHVDLNSRLLVTDVGGARYRAFWIFFRNELLVACPSPRCTIVDGAPAVEITFSRPGQYTTYTLVRDQQLPSPLPTTRAEIVTVGGKEQRIIIAN